MRMKPRGSNYRLKYHNFLFLDKKYIGCNLSLGQFSWGVVFHGAICQRGDYVDDKSSEMQFSSEPITKGILSGGNYFLGNCPGVIIQGVIIQGAIFLEGNYTRLQLSRGQLSRGQVSGGQLTGGKFSLGRIVWTPSHNRFSII